MGEYLLKRILQSITVIFLVSVLSFGLIHSAPGDPVNAIYGPKIQEMRPEDRERIRENLGLNRPVPVQYMRWIKGVMAGDLGHSYISGRPVSSTILERLPATVLLAGASSVLIVALSVILGVISGLKRNSTFDHSVTVVSLFLISTPGFWLALMLILTFCVGLKWLPSSGMTGIGTDFSATDLLRHLILPSVVLSFSHIGYYIRFVRAGVWEHSGMDYVWALRARGIKEKTIIYRHILKNSLLPFVNYLGVTIPVMLGGSVVIEFIFAWPGIGQLSVEAAAARDYGVLMGTVLLAGTMVVIGNFITDIICMMLDPRFASGQLGGEVNAG